MSGAGAGYDSQITVRTLEGLVSLRRRQEGIYVCIGEGEDQCVNALRGVGVCQRVCGSGGL